MDWWTDGGPAPRIEIRHSTEGNEENEELRGGREEGLVGARGGWRRELSANGKMKIANDGREEGLVDARGGRRRELRFFFDRSYS